MMHQLFIQFPNGKLRQWMFATEWEVRACIESMKLIHDDFCWSY